jgi:hypothetical protein
MRDYKCGFAVAGDYIGDGEGLTAAGDAEEGLVLFAIGKSVNEPVDCLWLIAPRLKLAMYRKLCHWLCFMLNALCGKSAKKYRTSLSETILPG